MSAVRLAFVAAFVVLGVGAPSLLSAQGLPASCTFSDDPISAGAVLVKKVHIDELRTCINDLRAQRSLGAFAGPIRC